MSNKIQKLFFTFLLLITFAESSFSKSNDLPSWFIKPRANNIDMIYGVAEGFTLEEATKTALADAAGRLMVSISSESELIKEENQNRRHQGAATHPGQADDQAHGKSGQNKSELMHKRQL